MAGKFGVFINSETRGWTANLRINVSHFSTQTSEWWWVSVLRVHLAGEFTVTLLNHVGTREKEEKLKQSTRKKMAHSQAADYTAGSEVKRPVALPPAPAINQVLPVRSPGGQEACPVADM